MSKPWPFDPRLSPSDVFDLVEMAKTDPTPFTPEQRAVLRSDPYGSWRDAQAGATDATAKRRRR